MPSFQQTILLWLPQIGITLLKIVILVNFLLVIQRALDEIGILKYLTYANLKNVDNKLSQAHFGLYCSPSVEKGVVYNDSLSIDMVDGE